MQYIYHICKKVLYIYIYYIFVKVIKRRSDKLYVKWKSYDNSFNG